MSWKYFSLISFYQVIWQNIFIKIFLSMLLFSCALQLVIVLYRAFPFSNFKFLRPIIIWNTNFHHFLLVKFGQYNNPNVQNWIRMINHNSFSTKGTRTWTFRNSQSPRKDENGDGWAPLSLAHYHMYNRGIVRLIM